MAVEQRKHGGSRRGAGAPRKWESEAARKRHERLEKRTAALLLTGKQFEAARSKLSDLLEENPAAFDYWAYLRYYAKYPDQRPYGVEASEVKQLFRKHPLSRLAEWAVVEAALYLNLLPWQGELWRGRMRQESAPQLGPSDWSPFVDLLPVATAKKGPDEWKAPAFKAEFADEIGPAILDGRDVFSFDDALKKPNKEES